MAWIKRYALVVIAALGVLVLERAGWHTWADRSAEAVLLVAGGLLVWRQRRPRHDA